MIKRFYGIMAWMIVLSGCASSNSVVLPRHDGAYEIISTSEAEVSSYQRAIRQAEKTCSTFEKNYRVHDRQTRYRGSLSPQTARLSRSFSPASLSRTHHNDESFPDDYQVTLLVTCV